MFSIASRLHLPGDRRFALLLLSLAVSACGDWHYNVALLNSKNAWRILGQESYSYEIAQDFDYTMADKVVVVPIGNAGNITAVMNGFLKFLDIGVIDGLPTIIGVQSVHANPVYTYYSQPDENRRKFVPMTVRPSVAPPGMSFYNRIIDQDDPVYLQMAPGFVLGMQI